MEVRSNSIFHIHNGFYVGAASCSSRFLADTLSSTMNEANDTTVDMQMLNCRWWDNAEYQQEIILLRFSGFGGKVKQVCVCEREGEGIHLSLMDLSRFLQGNCSKPSVICWAVSHCEKCRGWKMLSGNIWLLTNNYMSLFTFSLFLHLCPPPPPPLCRARWCGSWMAMCWSVWRTRTVTTWCRSVSNVSSLTHCTSS